MNIIKFTKPGGAPTYVNPLLVTCVEDLDGTTCIKTVNMSVIVTEPLEKVVEMLKC